MSEILKYNPETKKPAENQQRTEQTLNAMLEGLKKGNLSPKEKDYIVNFVIKIADIEVRYQEQAESTKKDIRFFVESSLGDKLYSHLSKYNISKFDVDGQKGLDHEEEKNYAQSIGSSIQEIILLGGINTFSQAYHEAHEKTGLSNGDKWLADKANVTSYIFSEKDGKNFAEGLIQKAGTISETELKKIQESPFRPTSTESWKETGILLAKEFGNGVEDVLRFLGNILAGLMLIPRYTAYRAMVLSSDPKTKTEGTIKLRELVEQNPSLGLAELLGEKGIEMMKKIAEMFTSGKQGDIAMLMVTIAGLVAGGVGVVRFGLKLSRKISQDGVRLAGSEARLAGKTTSRATRNALKSGAQKTGKVAEVAGRIDDIVGGAGIGHLTGSYSGANAEKIKRHETTKTIVDQKNIKKILDIIQYSDNDKSFGLGKTFEKIDGILNKGSIFNRAVAMEIIRIGGSDLVMKYFEKFTELNHNEIANALIDKGGWIHVVSNLQKFTLLTDYNQIAEKLIRQTMGAMTIPDILKTFPGIDRIKIANVIMDVPVKRRVLIANLEMFPGLNHVELIEKLMKLDDLPSVGANLEKFTGLDPKIYHPKIMDAMIQKGNLYSASDYLEKFTGLDPKIYHPQLFNALYQSGNWDSLIKNSEKFTGLDPKIQQFLKRIKRSEADTKIISRYSDLQEVIVGFDNIFHFYFKHKQKSLIPLMQKLLVAKDIGVKTNFKGITDILDTSWMTGKNSSEIKTQLMTIFSKLLDLTDAPVKEKSMKELENTLKQIKSFDEKAIEQIQLRFVNVVEIYFHSVYDRKVRQRFVNEFGLKDVERLDFILAQHPEIIEGFKMEQATNTNKKQFRDILTHAINNPGTPLDLSNLGKNKEWIARKSLRGKDMKLWLDRNERKYDIGNAIIKADKSKEIEHFVTVANSKLESLRLIPQKDAGTLINYFNTEIKKKKEDFAKESKLTSEEFNSLYNDLELQIQSIHNLLKETKSKEVTSLTIYKETDPAKVLMMGNWVDGSCLSFNSTVGNYWSTATNTLDINKGVFYIKDQNGSIIGRILTAIDNNGKLLRFGMYKKGNVGIDMDVYFDQYIKELSQKIGFGLNGDIKQVDLLNGERWYEDPVYDIK